MSTLEKNTLATMILLFATLGLGTAIYWLNQYRVALWASVRERAEESARARVRDALLEAMIDANIPFLRYQPMSEALDNWAHADGTDTGLTRAVAETLRETFPR